MRAYRRDLALFVGLALLMCCAILWTALVY